MIPLRSDSLGWQYECEREELPQCKREKFLPVLQKPASNTHAGDAFSSHCKKQKLI